MPVGVPPNAALPVRPVGGASFSPSGSTAWSSPSALLFYHLERTGGNTLQSWLANNGYSTPRRLGLVRRLNIAASYPSASCYMSAWPTLFPRAAERAARRPCSLRHFDVPWKSAPTPIPGGRFNWRSARVSIEFHDATRHLWWEELVPRLPELRAEYAALNGTLLTLTVLREPLAHVRSARSRLDLGYSNRETTVQVRGRYGEGTGKVQGSARAEVGKRQASRISSSGRRLRTRCAPSVVMST